MYSSAYASSDESSPSSPLQSAYSSLLHSYSERVEDEDDAAAVDTDAFAFATERALLEADEEDEGADEEIHAERSERVEEAEADEQERMREAGSMDLFGGDSLREEEDEEQRPIDEADTDETGQRGDGAAGEAAAIDRESDEHRASLPVTPQKEPRKRKREEEQEELLQPSVASTAPLRSPSAAPVPVPVPSPSLPPRAAASEFAVPEPPSASSAGRGRRATAPMYHQRAEDFSLSFSLPPSYSSLHPPSASFANVSPISHDYASSANFSPAPALPPRASQPSAPPTAALGHASAPGRGPPSSSSPPHRHYSPSFTALSPRIAWPPSSPRTDSVTSVTHRIEQWQRTGRVQWMMKNAHAHAAAHSDTVSAPTRQPSELVPSPSHASSASAPASSSSSSSSFASAASSRMPDSGREALLTVDRYLRRRFVFRLLDSDMTVKGVVYNKTSQGLVITISEVEGAEAALKGETPPTLSSASPEGKAEELSELEELEIRGECHLSEMHAALQSEQRTAGGTAAAGAGAGEVDSQTVLDGCDVGDSVRALVISVDVHSEKVYLSMNNARMRSLSSAAAAASTSSSAPPPLRLGPIRDASQSPHGKPLLPPTVHASADSLHHPTVNTLVSSLSSSLGSAAASPYPALATPSPASLPVPYGFPSFQRPSTSGASLSSPSGASSVYAPSLSSSSSFLVPRRRARPANYLSWLRTQPLFLNPAGLSILLRSYGINQYGSLLPPVVVPPSQLYHALRHAQNQAWARESTVKGIGMAKRGAYDNALKVYAHALEIEPKYVQAYVARGACYVLQGRWEDGVREFERALQLDPDHAYAKQYLRACRDKLGRRGGRDDRRDASEDHKERDSDGERERGDNNGRRGGGEPQPPPPAAQSAVEEGARAQQLSATDSDSADSDDDGRERRRNSRRGNKKERKRDRGRRKADRRKEGAQQRRSLSPPERGGDHDDVKAAQQSDSRRPARTWVEID